LLERNADEVKSDADRYFTPRPLKLTDLNDSVACHGRKHRRHEWQEPERFRRFAYDDLAKRDKLNLDIFWLKDASVTDPDTLPLPDEIAAEIVDSLETSRIVLPGITFSSPASRPGAFSTIVWLARLALHLRTAWRT
jgi:hypothetical protein